MNNIDLIKKLQAERKLNAGEWRQLLAGFSDDDRKFAADLAKEIAVNKFGRKIFIRGIVEFSNYCKNNCYYCGIRRGNKNCSRYRLNKDEIMLCCKSGYEYGFRTFVLQSGEDPFFTDERLIDIVSAIRAAYPDCAITLSIGERTGESYEKLFAAGADRFLLRHETADSEHYGKLHPETMSWQRRLDCLKALKKIGYQTGCGIMVGSPYQTVDTLVKDMLFMAAFRPQMIGIGPFLSHKDTPFRDKESGSVPLTLFLLSLCRIMLPDVLLPATTALGTAQGDGRQLGVLAGCNVIMPNLSPLNVRKNYMLYDNKVISGEDAGESLLVLREHMTEIGYEVVVDRGDYCGG
ncbi:MAG: [FeFe] hydrogenase H-cluster radical SAM maturase HydE [Bacillota bacterium]